MKTMRTLMAILAVALAAVAGAAVAAPPEEAVLQPVFDAVVAEVGPSVVSIDVVPADRKDDEDGKPDIGAPPPLGRRTNRGVRPSRRRGRSIDLGDGPTTGLIVSEDGYIVTSVFRVADAKKKEIIRVTLGDGRTFEAKKLGTDTSRGIVLLKIDAEGLPVPAMAPYDETTVGQWSLALGKGLGQSEPEMKVGIVSALDRIRGKAIQTDAATSPTNYGGPICDIQGRVMGILVPLTGRPQRRRTIRRHPAPKPEKDNKDGDKEEKDTDPEGDAPDDQGKKHEAPAPDDDDDKRLGRRDDDAPDGPDDDADPDDDDAEPDDDDAEPDDDDAEPDDDDADPDDDDAEPGEDDGDEDDGDDDGKKDDDKKKPKARVIRPRRRRAPAGARAVGMYDSGIAFAIPMEDILREMDTLKEGKTVERGVIGIQYKRKEDAQGAIVEAVAPESPAEKAGMRVDDLIVEVAGKPIYNHRHLLHAIGRFNAGDEVTLAVKRADERLDMTLTLAAPGDVKPFPKKEKEDGEDEGDKDDGDEGEGDDDGDGDEGDEPGDDGDEPGDNGDEPGDNGEEPKDGDADPQNGDAPEKDPEEG